MAFGRGRRYYPRMSPARPLCAPAATGLRVAAGDVGARPGCRLCGRPLSALERVRGDLCDAMDCRRHAADAIAGARRRADIEAVRAAATPALADAAIVWLTYHDATFAAPLAIDVAQLREHLTALEHDPSLPQPADDAQPSAGSAPEAIGGHLCALCRGRCCRMGLHCHAFLRAEQLRDWLAGRPDATWTDAVDHYLGFVAPQHLDQSCLFHGAQGCTLARERRSAICNDYACETLGQVRRIAAAEPDAAVVVGIVRSHALASATAVSAQGSRPLPGPGAAA
jgi:hypothetical protein